MPKQDPKRDRDIDWRQLYDALTDRYESLEKIMQESKSAMERTIRQIGEDKRKELLHKFCEVVDNVDHLVKAVHGHAEPTSLTSGIGLIERSIVDFMKREGVTPVTAMPGTQFDPKIHEAVGVTPSSIYEQEHIVEEVRKGYQYRDILLRPARVVVSSGPPTASS